MKTSETTNVEPYLERLRALPFVKGVEARDGHLSLRTPKARHAFAVEIKSVPLTRAAALSAIAGAQRKPGEPRIVFSPYVSQPVGQLLASQNVGYVDLAGNGHVAVGRDYLVHVEGRRRQMAPRSGRGLGARSYQVLFALLARPELAAAPIRSLAEASGVRKTATADLLKRLRGEGFVLRDQSGLRLARASALMDRWVAGYTDQLRPRLLMGRYRAAAREPSAFEKHVEATLGNQRTWAWGGASGGYRLTEHYRSSTTILHLAGPVTAVQRQLDLLPARDGPIVVLGTPGPLGLEGPVPHVAHPLLVYTELLVDGDERALEAAAEIRSRFLGQIE